MIVMIFSGMIIVTVLIYFRVLSVLSTGVSFSAVAPAAAASRRLAAAAGRSATPTTTGAGAEERIGGMRDGGG